MTQEGPNNFEPMSLQPVDPGVAGVGSESTSSANAGSNQEITEDPAIAELVEGVNPAALDEEALETLVDKHPLIMAKTAALAEKRRNRQLSSYGERSFVEDITRSRQQVAGKIQRKLGIYVEDPEAKERRLERERVRSLGRIISEVTDDEPDDALLVKFGLIDHEGNMTPGSMESPLFKADTKSAFEAYMNYAVQYDILEQAEAAQGGSLKNTAQANVLRRQAHNVVSKLVQRDLGLPFQEARRFVAKSREARVPGTHEKTSYAQHLRGQKLAEQFGHDAVAFTRDSLGSIIADPMQHEREESNN